MKDYQMAGLLILFFVITMIYGLFLVWVATKEAKARRIHELKVTRIVENNRLMIQKYEHSVTPDKTIEHNWGKTTTLMKKVN
jgi:hypothetical protein